MERLETLITVLGAIIIDSFYQRILNGFVRLASTLLSVSDTPI